MQQLPPPPPPPIFSSFSERQPISATRKKIGLGVLLKRSTSSQGMTFVEVSWSCTSSCTCCEQDYIRILRIRCEVEKCVLMGYTSPLTLTIDRMQDIIPGFAAANSGQIKVSDLVLSIDGTSVKGWGIDDIKQVILPLHMRPCKSFIIALWTKYSYTMNEYLTIYLLFSLGPSLVQRTLA